jgi:hypothetical protein
MKGTKIAYYASTGLVTAFMVMSAGMYFFKHDMVAEMWTQMGFPTWIIYPLATAKILGLIAIWTKKSRTLKEWAYAGFFFDFILASFAHYFAGEGVNGMVLPLTIAALLIVSYTLGLKIEKNAQIK